MVAGLLLPGPALGLGPQAPLLELGVGVVGGPGHQVVLLARVDLGGLGHQGRPAPGEPPVPEGLVQGGLVGQVLPQAEEVLRLPEGVPGPGGQQLGRRAVAGAQVAPRLLHPAGGQGLARHPQPLQGGEEADQGHRVVPGVPLGLQGRHVAGQDRPGPLGLGEVGGTRGPGRPTPPGPDGVEGPHCHGASGPRGCITHPGRATDQGRRPPARDAGDTGPGGTGVPEEPGPGGTAWVPRNRPGVRCWHAYRSPRPSGQGPGSRPAAR